MQVYNHILKGIISVSSKGEERTARARMYIFEPIL